VKLIRAATRDVKILKRARRYQQWQARAQEQQPDPEMTNAKPVRYKKIAEARMAR